MSAQGEPTVVTSMQTVLILLDLLHVLVTLDLVGTDLAAQVVFVCFLALLALGPWPVGLCHGLMTMCPSVRMYVNFYFKHLLP